MGFLVNLVGIFAFQHGHAHGGNGQYFLNNIMLMSKSLYLKEFHFIHCLAFNS